MTPGGQFYWHIQVWKIQSSLVDKSEMFRVIEYWNTLKDSLEWINCKLPFCSLSSGLLENAIKIYSFSYHGKLMSRLLTKWRNFKPQLLQFLYNSSLSHLCCLDLIHLTISSQSKLNLATLLELTCLEYINVMKILDIWGL